MASRARPASRHPRRADCGAGGDSDVRLVAALLASASAGARLTAILRVGDGLHPTRRRVDVDGEVRAAFSWRRAVPVLLSRLNDDGVAGAHLVGRLAELLHANP